VTSYLHTKFSKGIISHTANLAEFNYLEHSTPTTKGVCWQYYYETFYFEKVIELSPELHQWTLSTWRGPTLQPESIFGGYGGYVTNPFQFLGILFLAAALMVAVT
jgi:hypothetical protein